MSNESNIQLRGKNGNYFFDPDDKASLLRGKGKFSSVYSGVRISDNMQVAIKSLNPKLCDSPQDHARFLKEAGFSFDHPNIYKTLDFISDKDGDYIVREYIDGENLMNLSKKGKLKKAGIPFYLKCMKGLLRALEELHSQNIIHCDIRPSNIMVEFKKNTREIDFENPVVKLIDLGLARINNSRETKTPFALIYSSPEQLLNFEKLVNPSSDLYSMGITFYELLTGEKPFYSEHPVMIMTLQVTQELSKHRKIPEPLFTIIKKATAKYNFKLPPRYYEKDELEIMLAKGIENRYQTAREMLDDINGLINDVLLINDTRKSFFNWFRN